MHIKEKFYIYVKNTTLMIIRPIFHLLYRKNEFLSFWIFLFKFGSRFYPLLEMWDICRDPRSYIRDRKPPVSFINDDSAKNANNMAPHFHSISKLFSEIRKTRFILNLVFHFHSSFTCG